MRTLAHAEGGGVLYVPVRPIRDKSRRIVRREPRPARRLQPAQPPARRPRCGALLGDVLAVLAEVGGRPARDASAAAATPSEALDVPLEHEWANDPERVATVTIDLVDDLDEAVAIANERDLRPRRRDRRRGPGAAADASSPATAARRRSGSADAVRRRLRADRRARDGDQRRLGARAAGAVTYRDLAPPVPDRRRRHAAPVSAGRRQAGLEPRRRARRRRAPRPVARPRAGDRGARARRRRGLRRLVGAIALGLPRLGLAAAARVTAAPGRRRRSGQARLQAAWEAALGGEGTARRAGAHDRATSLTARAYVNARSALNASRPAPSRRERERRDRDRRDHVRRQRRARGAGRRAPAARVCSCS